MYVQGVIAEVARKENRSIVWYPGVRKNTFALSLNDTHHRELIYENNEEWKILTDKIK